MAECRTAVPGRGRAGGRRTRHPDRVRVRDPRRGVRRSTSPAPRAHPRQCQLPDRRDPLGVLLRVRCLPSRIPASGGPFAPLAVARPAGCLVHARAVGRRRATRRRRAASSTSCWRRWGRPSPCRRRGGHDEQPRLGGERFTYYETIGGGQGAAGAGGPSGVHVGMSNTLTTPVEALELAFPLRVSARRSAGQRRRRPHPGGDGIVRELACSRLPPVAPERAALARAARRRRRRGRRAGRNLVNGEPAAAEGGGRPAEPATS